MGRFGGALAAVASFSVLALATCACPALAASPPAPQTPQWQATQLPGSAAGLFLLNVSCPSASFCVATGTQNLIASSTDPTGGPGAWNVVYAGEGRYESSPGAPPVITNRQVQGVSCPTSGLCVAVTTLGQILSSTDPTGPASAWKVTEVSATGANTHLYGVSCPTESLCVAVSGRRTNRGKVFTSTAPASGLWQEADLGEAPDLRAVSCSSPAFCVAVGYNGEVVVSGDPSGGASAWSVVGAPGGGGVLQAVDCLSTICLTGDSGGELLTAAEPTSFAGWHGSPGGGSVQVTGASCATSEACLAVDDNGDAIVSTEPASGRWALTNLRPYTAGVESFASEDANALFGASCPTTEFCALVGARGTILTSTDPFVQEPAKAPATPAGHGKKKKPRQGPKRPRVQIAHVRLPRPADAERGQGKVMVRFYARGPLRRFECRLDAHGFAPCRSPRRFQVGLGRHRLAIRAVGLAGLRGPLAAERWVTFAPGHCLRSHPLHHRCLEGSVEITGS